MRRLRAFASVIGAVAALSAACGSPPTLTLPTPTPAAPASSAYLGIWDGTLTDQTAGIGAITLVFNQASLSAAGGVNVSGTFNIQRQDGSGVAVVCVNGSVFGSDVQQVFSASCSTEMGSISVTIDDMHVHASGTYVFAGAPFGKGTVQLDKH